MRRGYSFEYWVKQQLIKQYGKDSVIKLPFWEFKGDFLVINGDRILKVVECKKHKSKFYPTKKEKEQILKIIEFCKNHNVLGEFWVKEGRKLTILNLNEVKNKYINGGECVHNL
ncbi:MAG: hypothetical protein QXG39_00235 [Candidatus Aenigmatarchaeota archaeon]